MLFMIREFKEIGLGELNSPSPQSEFLHAPPTIKPVERVRLSLFRCCRSSWPIEWCGKEWPDICDQCSIPP